VGTENEHQSTLGRFSAWLRKQFRRDVYTHLGLPPWTVDNQKGPNARGDSAPDDQ
jgi:hypothetical protein